MALTYKRPSEVAAEYLQNLKAIKPEVNTDQTDSDWWIRSRVVGGVIAGVYADQQKIAGDIFPQSARSEAIDRHLDVYGIGPRNPAQEASGTVSVSGDVGTVYTVGTQFEHEPTGNVYSVTEELTLTGPTGSVSVQSVSTGQSQNLNEGTSLTLPSPPSGSESEAEVISISDGRDEETDEEASARVLARIQTPISGGTETDYRQWALEADGSVTSANVVRFVFGAGTVGIYITSGTTDIDTAIDEDQAIVRTPSQELIDTVQEYIESVNPLTDCAHVFGASETSQDVTARIKYKEGVTGDTVISGQTLTLNEILEREIRRAIYKIPIGGRKLGASGYVLASEIEEAIDFTMSALPYQVGSIAEVLIDRQVDDLAATSTNRLLGNNEIVEPGTITIVEL